MAIEIWPITDDFAAEVGDADLSKPLSDADWADIEAAYHRYAVLVFPDQHLTQSQHVDFARRFGEIDRSMQKNLQMQDSRLPGEIADVGNLDPDGQLMKPGDRMLGFSRANRLWHTDSSFKPVPANASCLHIRTTPPVGGMTEFADMRAAWDALPAALRAMIDGHVAMHSIATSRARLGFDMTAEERQRYPAVPQAMVRTHRVGGRRSIYVASHAGAVLGMSEHEGRALIDTLLEHSTRRQFVYTHRWRANDLVVWDNRCTMHRGRPYDDLRWPRDAQRATSQDVAPTWAQEGLRIDEAGELRVV